MPLRFLVLILSFACFIRADAQQHGLNTRPAFTAFNNNALPPNASSISGTWSAVPVWPSLKFSNPLGILQETGTQRMIVWEREGHVYAFDKATGANKTLILDISAHTQGWDDCGLLNIVCHPDYATNHFVFIYYCWVDGITHKIQGSSNARVPTEHVVNWKRLSRFTMKPDGTLDPASETVLWHQKCASLWHSGSGMFFHPDDGFLYFINGDDFDPAKAQTFTKGLFSGIFRIDVDQRGGSISHALPAMTIDDAASYRANYFIPNDNPLVGQAGVFEEYIALGVRSPHRLTLDPVTKRMFHSDVGDASREEINVFEPGEVMPNYQWPKFEGLVGKMTAPYIGLDKPPILDYTHADGQAVIGGYVYRGTEFPELQGKYIFGDNMVGIIWYLDESTTPATKVPICKLSNGPGKYTGDNYLGLSSFGVDANSELYLVRMSFTDGAIMKLSRTGGNANTPPATLSQTNVFSDLGTLTTNTGFIAYDVNTPLWSDGAEKQRWFAVPSGQRIGYAPTGEWSFPTGSVFVKHFELNTDETQPAQRRRLETRVLVRDNQGYVYGASYKWRADNSDADIVNNAQSEDITITTASGTRTQSWLYPGRQTCLSCHTTASKGVLGLNTPQIHRDHVFDAITDNQLRAWSHVGYFTPAIDEATLSALQTFAALDNTSASLELRARSYLDANCSHCHRPGGTSHAMWDARIETPLESAGIINGPVVSNLGQYEAHVVSTIGRGVSILDVRLSSVGTSDAMPPIAKTIGDLPAVLLVRQWIASLPTPPELPPDVVGTSAQLGATWGLGSGSMHGDQCKLFHQDGPPDTPGEPKVEESAGWFGLPFKGDGWLLAHVALVATNHSDLGFLAGPGLSYGMMMRASMANGAAKVATTWTEADFIGNTATPAPRWVMMGRSGTSIITATSTDGFSWLQTKTPSTLPATAFIGMWSSAGTNGDASRFGSATFDQVRFLTSVPWACAKHPMSQLVRSGDLVEFGVETVGLPPTSYQWRKNNVSISRAVSDRYAFKATLVSAGSYNVLTGSKLLSIAANLVVLDKVTYTNNLAPNTTATFTLTYAGTGATMVWTKDGVPLQNDGRIAGATTGKLSIAKLTLADIGDYECVVSGFGSTQVLGPFPLHVLSKPTITAIAPPAWTESRAFSWQLTADEPVSSYVVTGLPSGLIYNATTGLVSGTPNVGGTFTIKVYARNAAGTGPTQTFTWSVEGFPTAAGGGFSCLVDRDVINAQFGGLLTLNITTTGVATGRLTLGALAYPLSGRAVFITGSDPTLTFTIMGTPTKVVSIAIGQTTGVVTGDVNGTPIHGRRNLGWENAATFNTELLQPDTNAALPQGTGWVRISVSAVAGVTFLGRLPDNALISGSSFVRDDETIAWHQLLYSNKGSIQGEPLASGNNASGSIGWFKISSIDHNYESGFPLTTLTASGAKFVAVPSGSTFLGLTSARIEFTGGGISAAAPANKPNQNFTLTTAHRALFSTDYVNVNPCYDTLAIAPSTGYFTGTVKLKDGTLARTLTFQGLLLNGRSEAHGAFVLRQLPGLTTSPILSGGVRILADPP